MLRSLLFIPSIILCTLFLEAQTTIDYNWQKPKYDVPIEDTALNDIILLDYRIIDFKKVKAPYISISHKKKLVHRIIYLNNDSIIDQYSQLKIPVETTADILRLQVRVLTNNKKTELAFEALKDSIRLEEDVMVLPIHAIPKGAVLEYLYEIKMAPNAYGSELFQTDLPIKYAELQLLSNGLAFDLKGYNGIQTTTTKEGIKKHTYGSVLKNIPAFQEAFYAANEANKMRIDYAVKGMDWNMMSQVIALNVMDTKKKIKKKVEQELNSQLKLLSFTTKAEKISAIEHYIKLNYEVINDDTDELSNLKDILVTKQANENGIVYLFAAFFNAANISYEVAATTDRFARTFDQDFATPLNLGYFLFYFSDEKQFLTPYPYRYTYGTVPDYLLGQEALSVTGSYSKGKGMISNHRFVEMTNTNDFTTEISEDIIIDLSRHEEIFIAKMMDVSGYRALEFIHDYNQSEHKKAFITEFLAIENVALSYKVLINGNATLPEQLSGQNVIVYAELQPETFIGKSGDDTFVFCLGKLIGKQMKLDETEERTQAVEFNSPIQYHRKIRIEKDAKCTVVDVGAFNIETDLSPKEKENMDFKASVKTSNDKIDILIDEYYRFLQLDQKDYPAFRQVINAAADFNEKNIMVRWE